MGLKQFFEHFSSNSQIQLKNSFGLRSKLSDPHPSSFATPTIIVAKPTPLKEGFASHATQKSQKLGHLDIYSPFRLLANFAAQDYNFKEINPWAFGFPVSLLQSQPLSYSRSDKKAAKSSPSFTNEFTKNEEFSKHELFKLFTNTLKKKGGQRNNISKLLTELGQKNFAQKINSLPRSSSEATRPLRTALAKQPLPGDKARDQDNFLKTSEKALSQRNLRKEYVQDKILNSYHNSKLKWGNGVLSRPTERWEGKGISDLSSSSFASTPLRAGKGTSKLNKKTNSLNYLDFYSYNDSYAEFRNTQRGKQTERTLQEEEAKKVFVIINSFGGSVGNGITVHDALQFIKAGSLTLALGVAASASSLVLAGGTIGERYVTEGCHTMIHQPESSIQGQASDIWIDSQEIMKIRLDVAEIYSLACYRPRHKILRDLDRDFYLTASESIHYGLADEIASNEVMQEIISSTNKVWDYHDTKQQRLLESRDVSNSGMDTQSQN